MGALADVLYLLYTRSEPEKIFLRGCTSLSRADVGSMVRRKEGRWAARLSLTCYLIWKKIWRLNGILNVIRVDGFYGHLINENLGVFEDPYIRFLIS